MLTTLSVENYALIEHLEMSLDGSLNIITGETGAGKSILLGALGLLLGAKNDGTATADNTKSCVIEGVFAVAGLELEELFTQMDWEWEEHISIRRVITAAGKSRSFVGDIPVSLSDLKRLSSKLIDIHSQHQNQILEEESFRIKVVDSLYDSAEPYTQYIQAFQSLTSLRGELQQVEQIAASAKRDEEWLTHQVEELTAAALREGEQEEAEAELNILENAESIREVLANFTLKMDSDDEGGVLISLRTSEREMESISKHYPAAADYAERLRSVIAELKDMNSSVAQDCDSVEADPQRLNALSDRIDTLYSLCKKHRAESITELIEIRDRYSEQLLTILNSDDRIAELRRRITKEEQRVRECGARITKLRRSVAPQIEQAICTTLSRLGMSEAQLRVEITAKREPAIDGCDQIEFLFSSVQSKSLQRVEKIASGGEISRLMLAIKSLLAEHTLLPTIIFDEIDTGVSGRIADAMGEIIAEMSRRRQIVDITHLPQVASKGDSHFVVYKESGRTNITKLTAPERINAIATMLSGESVTTAAIKQAEILLSNHTPQPHGKQ